MNIKESSTAMRPLLSKVYIKNKTMSRKKHSFFSAHFIMMSVTYAKAGSLGSTVTLTKAQADKFHMDFVNWNFWNLDMYDRKKLLDPQFDTSPAHAKESLRLYRQYRSDSPFGLPYEFFEGPGNYDGLYEAEDWEDFLNWRLCKLRDEALDKGRCSTDSRTVCIPS